MKKAIMVAATSVFLLGGISATTALAGPERKCKSCHNFTQAHKVGPSLQAVFGRAAGSTDFKKYSKDLKAGGWTWDENHLRAWMCNSTKAIKTFTGNSKAKTKMPKQRICDKTKQDKVIAALKAL